VAKSLLNQVVPDSMVIEKFKVALGQAVEEADLEKIAASSKTTTWLASRKLDGARCVCLVSSDGRATFMTRGGNVINGTEALGKEVLSLLGSTRDVVLDGELCFPEQGLDDNGNSNGAAGINEGGKEDFQVSHLPPSPAAFPRPSTCLPQPPSPSCFFLRDLTFSLLDLGCGGEEKVPRFFQGKILCVRHAVDGGLPEGREH